MVETASIPPGLERAQDQRAETPAIRRRRILVVYDHHDAARILALLLESLGHEVQTAHDGTAALDAVHEFRPDVMFLDIGLPQIDGYEVARRVRELPEGKGLRLVALTGWGHAQARQRSREAGFDDHLVKPAAAKALRELLAD
jgi:CheY-like chemotaxis protein